MIDPNYRSDTTPALAAARSAMPADRRHTASAAAATLVASLSVVCFLWLPWMAVSGPGSSGGSGGGTATLDAFQLSPDACATTCSGAQPATALWAVFVAVLGGFAGLGAAVCLTEPANPRSARIARLLPVIPAAMLLVVLTNTVAFASRLHDPGVLPAGGHGAVSAGFFLAVAGTASALVAALLCGDRRGRRGSGVSRLADDEICEI